MEDLFIFPQYVLLILMALLTVCMYIGWDCATYVKALHSEKCEAAQQKHQRDYDTVCDKYGTLTETVSRVMVHWLCSWDSAGVCVGRYGKEGIYGPPSCPAISCFLHSTGRKDSTAIVRAICVQVSTLTISPTACTDTYHI